MKIVCPNCSARYRIADEKITSQTVGVRCKKCGTLIQLALQTEAALEQAQAVEAALGHTAAASPAPHLAGATPAVATTALAGAFGGAAAAADDRGTTRHMDALPPELLAQAQRETDTASTVWFIAQQGKSHGPYSLAELAEQLRDGKITLRTHFWTDGFAGWVRLEALSDIEKALRRLGGHKLVAEAAPEAAPAPKPAAAPTPAAAPAAAPTAAAGPIQPATPLSEPEFVPEPARATFDPADDLTPLHQDVASIPTDPGLAKLLSGLDDVGAAPAPADEPATKGAAPAPAEAPKPSPEAADLRAAVDELFGDIAPTAQPGPSPKPETGPVSPRIELTNQLPSDAGDLREAIPADVVAPLAADLPNAESTRQPTTAPPKPPTTGPASAAPKPISKPITAVDEPKPLPTPKAELSRAVPPSTEARPQLSDKASDKTGGKLDKKKDKRAATGAQPKAPEKSLDKSLAEKPASKLDTKAPEPVKAPEKGTDKAAEKSAAKPGAAPAGAADLKLEALVDLAHEADKGNSMPVRTVDNTRIALMKAGMSTGAKVKRYAMIGAGVVLVLGGIGYGLTQFGVVSVGNFLPASEKKEVVWDHNKRVGTAWDRLSPEEKERIIREEEEKEAAAERKRQRAAQIAAAAAGNQPEAEAAPAAEEAIPEGAAALPAETENVLQKGALRKTSLLDSARAMQSRVGSLDAANAKNRRDSAAISTVVKQNQGRVRSCYERELKRDPTLGGRVDFKFVITPQGNTTEVKITASKIKNPFVMECMRGVIGSMQFGPYEGDETEYSFSMLLSAGF